MFGNSYFDHIRKIFADQFVSDAHGYIYRKGQKGAAFRVSEAERDNFIGTFNKRIRYASWSIVPATISLILLLAWLISEGDRSEAKVASWIGVGAILLPFLAFSYWSWNAPTRELRKRTPESPALSESEARALAFSKITYGQLSLAALIGIYLVWKKSLKTDVLQGWGIIWLLMGGGLVLLAAVQVLRKWRFSQQQSSE